MEYTFEPPPQRPKWVFTRTFLPWIAACPLLYVTNRSFAKASYHSLAWAVVGAAALCVLLAWCGIPFGRNSGSFRLRLKLLCVTWALPLGIIISCAFDLPARYADGVITTTTVRYHTSGISRHCTVVVSFHLESVGGTVQTCVRRETVGAVPGNSSAEVTAKVTPYGAVLLKFAGEDL